MHTIRNAILSLALIAGLSPAIAQVPPPVPALPDTERRTSYSISASTCACAVGFQLYGDSTDYANWLEVFVNGVLITQAGNWTITSPTGSLSTIPRPITDAVLTFTVAQTGTVQIVGARRPRRTSQFQENQPVPTRNFNVVFSDLTAQNREVWDKINDVTGRSVRTPPGETLAMLPVLASRANMGACFDSGGNLTSCVAASSGSFAAGNGILFTGTNPTTIANNIQAGTGITFSGTNPIIIKSGGANGGAYVLPGDYNFTCDGVTDFATQLQAMITGSAGKTIFIPPGPDCLTSATLTLPSNTTIIGGGREVSTIRSTTAAPVFSSTNTSNISLNNFWCKGSDAVVSWVASSYGCIQIIQNGSAVTNGTNYNIQNMKFSNFNASYWVYIAAVGSTPGMANITFSNNYMLAVAGDIPSSGTASQNTNYGLNIWSGSAGNGRIENTIIQNNRFDVTGMCFPVVLFTNHFKFNVSGNVILNPGQTTPGHCISGTGTNNAYGILVYDINGDGNWANTGLIDSNVIVNPYSSGIYMPGGGSATPSVNNADVVISNNLITGQTSNDDSSLPRAGIAVTGYSGVDIKNNKVVNGFGGIAAVAQTIGTAPIVIENNTCTTNIPNGAAVASCIRLGPFAAASNTVRYIVKGNYLETSSVTSSAVRAFSATGARFADVEFSDNTIIAAQIGLDFSSQWVTGSLVFKNNRFGGIASNKMFDLSALNGVAALIGNVFDSSNGVSGNGLLAANSTIHMSDNKFINRASGAVPMYTAIGACGTIAGTQFNAVVQAAQVAATSLGTANPSGCTLNYLDQVQNLTPSEAGSAASKYVVDHWTHVATSPSTTHLEQRQLTGN